MSTPVSYTHLDVYKRQVYVLTISIYAGLAMFNESYMLWKGNNSPQISDDRKSDICTGRELKNERWVMPAR